MCAPGSRTFFFSSMGGRGILMRRILSVKRLLKLRGREREAAALGRQRWGLGRHGNEDTAAPERGEADHVL